ncbi:hypothetical protein MRX96_054308 [Rhipicephalus microplus]
MMTQVWNLRLRVVQKLDIRGLACKRSSHSHQQRCIPAQRKRKNRTKPCTRPIVWPRAALSPALMKRPVELCTAPQLRQQGDRKAAELQREHNAAGWSASSCHSEALY